MKTPAMILPLLALTLLYSQSAFPQQAQQDDLKSLRKEMEALKEGQSRIEKSLQEIRSLLQSRPSDQVGNIVLNVANEPFLGEKTAKLTLVEFSDYQ